MSATTASALVLDSPRAFARFVEALRPRARQGALAAVMLDRHFQLLGVDDSYLDVDRRERWQSVLDGLGDREPGAQVLLVTNRGGRGRVARPSDEVRWERWWLAARDEGVRLLDWWVLTDPDFAYSVARFSQRPAAWVD